MNKDFNELEKKLIEHTQNGNLIWEPNEEFRMWRTECNDQIFFLDSITNNIYFSVNNCLKPIDEFLSELDQSVIDTAVKALDTLGV